MIHENPTGRILCDECRAARSGKEHPLHLPPPGANGNPPMNHALAVLYALSLALTAPDKARELKAANLTVDLYHQSELTEEDLSILKAAAIVIADYGVE